MYTASATGMAGDVPVAVTIKDGRIDKVEVGENAETIGIGTNAIEQIPAAIIKAQSYEVEAVSGASITSGAIRDAVKACLIQASM